MWEVRKEEIEQAHSIHQSVMLLELQPKEVQVKIEC